MPHANIVGLGPSDAQLLTVGALDCLRKASAVFPCNAAPATIDYLREHGTLVENPTFDGGALLRGVDADVKAAAASLQRGGAALAVPGHPLLDFPGLPNLLHQFSRTGIEATIVAGVPRSALSAAAVTPLLPLPPTAVHHSWEELVEIMARLRACCPWDREQTHETLLPYLVEEAHEVVEAVDEGDPKKLCEELGDLLLQIVFHAEIACEQGRFSRGRHRRARQQDDTPSSARLRRREHLHVAGADAVVGADQNARELDPPPQLAAGWHTQNHAVVALRAARARESPHRGL